MNALSKLHHFFKDKHLLRDALTHSLVQKKQRKKHRHLNFNELNEEFKEQKKEQEKETEKEPNAFQRLEFLGDRVLNLIISEELFKRFPFENQGHLSKRYDALVCGTTCFKVAKESLNLDTILITSQKTISKGTLADSVESILGAMYLDSGLETCKAFVLEHWKSHLDQQMRLPPPLFKNETKHKEIIMEDQSTSSTLGPAPLAPVVN
jgi:dsRNA-specific ribonuclease